ncbi:hypothetical protein EP342_02595 [bacterium]|nr:MAG: hypothetical protein EP342_02595 [bacterium]
MSNLNKNNPFDDEFEDENSGESLLSTKDLLDASMETNESFEEFESSFSVPKFDTKSKKYDKSFIESEELEESKGSIEINNPTDTQSKAEVYVNRRKNGELDSIEVIASNGERILIHFETDENIESAESDIEQPTT